MAVNEMPVAARRVARMAVNENPVIFRRFLRMLTPFLSPLDVSGVDMSNEEANADDKDTAEILRPSVPRILGIGCNENACVPETQEARSSDSSMLALVHFDEQDLELIVLHDISDKFKLPKSLDEA